MKKLSSLVSLVLLFVINLQPIFACGPFVTTPTFYFTKHGDYPLADFSRGKLGIVPFTFGRASLFAAYRVLNNLPLSPNEQRDYADLVKERIDLNNFTDKAADNNSNKETSGLSQWVEARKKVLGADAKIEIQTERRVKTKEGWFNFFPNCYDDAFGNAARTLAARITQYGADNSSVKDWLSGQDAVFANCSEGETQPAVVINENAPVWLVKDRAYQTAAAAFYMQQFPLALELFQKIAADNDSEWRQAAKYLVARTYLRQASFTESGAEKKALLEKAQTQLTAILADAALKTYHESARGLVNLVKYRLNPVERARELAQILNQSNPNPNFRFDLIDYLWLLDKFENGEVEKDDRNSDKELKTRLLIREDDLTDWLYTYQTQNSDAFAHSFEKWQTTRKAHWLLAALAKADKNSPQTTELLGAADKIERDSPAYATARYQQIRLLIELNRRSEARRKLDEILANNFERNSFSTQNRFLAERMIVSQDLNEFLKFAQRKTAVFDTGDDGNEAGYFPLEEKDSELKIWANRPLFDEDATRVLNDEMPLASLREAALNPDLPAHLRKFLTIAVWTRAFVLGNQTIEREFAPLLVQQAPEFQPLFSKYAAAASPIEREAARLIAVLRYPALQPFVESGFNRADSTSISSIDSIRGNWWCTEIRQTERDPSLEPFQYPRVAPNFLTAAQKAAAKREREQMAASGNSATVLAQRALDFAAQNPAHPQTPEILHLAVRSTRYGCTDKATAKLSKAAFTILHKNYPASAWTKQTPYWFGNN